MSASEAMEWLAAADPCVVFVGQGVGCTGSRMSASFEGIMPERRLEFPVAEELQMGLCIGLALEGALPVCVYPRFNFVLRALDQLVHHLDRIPLYSGYKPKVIVRTAVGRAKPLDPGFQHADDYTVPLSLMLRTVRVLTVEDEGRMVEAVQAAYRRDGSTLLVERF